MFAPSSEHTEHTSVIKLLMSISNTTAPTACQGFWFAYRLGIPHRTEIGRSGSNRSQMGWNRRVQRTKNRALTWCKQHNTAYFLGGAWHFANPQPMTGVTFPLYTRQQGGEQLNHLTNSSRNCLGSAEWRKKPHLFASTWRKWDGYKPKTKKLWQ